MSKQDGRALLSSTAGTDGAFGGACDTVPMVAVRVAPARILVAGSVVAVAIVVLDLWRAWSMPWLGVEFAAPARGTGIVVARVFDHGPAHGALRPGDVVTTIEAGDGTSLLLSAVLLSRATYSLPSYAAFNRFFAEHRALWRAMNEEEVALVRADGTRAVLRPQAHRPVTSLPADFWAMARLAVVAPLIGVGEARVAARPPALAARNKRQGATNLMPPAQRKSPSTMSGDRSWPL